MRVYVTYSQGSLYVQSNYKSTGFPFPTKIATTEKIDLLNLVYNLVGEGSAEEIRHAIDHQITFFVDPSVKRFDPNLYEELISAQGAKAPKIEAGPTSTHGSAIWRAIRDRETHEAAIRAELNANSSPSVTLFSIEPSTQGGMTVHLPSESLHLSTEQLAVLQSGKQLPADHPLSKRVQENSGRSLVLFTKGGNDESLRMSDSFAFAIQKAYQTAHVCRDPFSESTVPSATDLQRFVVQGPDDVVTLIAADSFDVNDWKILANLRPALAGFNHTYSLHKGSVPKWTGGNKKAVIVITGHIDAKLVEFIDELGAAGYFEGNYVLLNTCNEIPTRALASKIISSYKAVSTFCYDSRIDAGAVEESLFDLVAEIKKRPNNFPDLLQKVLNVHRLNGIWTLCKLNNRLSWERNS
jgi:hypothetical protein